MELQGLHGQLLAQDKGVRRVKASCTLTSLLLAVLIGLSVGLLGGGGAILAVPIFNYVLGFGAKKPSPRAWRW